MKDGGIQPEGSPVSEGLHLVDGDIIAYRCAAATDGRYYLVGDVEFQYKGDAIRFCKMNNFPLDKIEQHFDPEPVSHAIHLMKDMINRMETIEIYLSDKRNFRFDILESYKASRKNKRRPKWLSECKKWLVKHKGATIADDLEADDAIIIRSTELDAEGVPHKIASIDKDLKQKHGIHYDFINDVTEEISEAGARRNLWLQICSGDTTDDIYSPHGLGPARADAFYKKQGVDWEETSDQELYKLTHDLYMTWLKQEEGEDEQAFIDRAKDLLDTVAPLVYLLRSKDDKWIQQTKEAKEVA